MKKSRLLLLSVLWCAGTALPAMAAMDRIGSVNVAFGGDRDIKNFNFGGPVDSLELRADRSDINCRSVRATFDNGRTRDIFHGRLREGRPANVDLPGDARNIRRLAFSCGAQDHRGGIIQIAADIGSHRDAWRRSPDWNRTWAKVFNWGSNAINNWRMIGSEHFEGRGDRESTFAGFRGKQVDSVALKPLETDARCSRVTASFDRGRGKSLNVNNGDVLRQGQFYKLDLPGNSRNLKDLSLQCQAVRGGGVTVQIFVGG